MPKFKWSFPRMRIFFSNLVKIHAKFIFLLHWKLFLSLFMCFNLLLFLYCTENFHLLFMCHFVWNQFEEIGAQVVTCWSFNGPLILQRPAEIFFLGSVLTDKFCVLLPTGLEYQWYSLFIYFYFLFLLFICAHNGIFFFN
jgi:hypothetical protein